MKTLLALGAATLSALFLLGCGEAADESSSREAPQIELATTKPNEIFYTPVDRRACYTVWSSTNHQYCDWNGRNDCSRTCSHPYVEEYRSTTGYCSCDCCAE